MDDQERYVDPRLQEREVEDSQAEADRQDDNIIVMFDDDWAAFIVGPADEPPPEGA